MKWPPMISMRQEFDSASLDDLEGELARGIRDRLARSQWEAGQSVAVGVGSRGVSPLRRVVSTVVRELRAAGLKPFIVPAMGSHGGATAEGQRQVLAELGVTAEAVGAEIRATMETVLLGKTPRGVEIYWDANAFGADRVVVIGRVKPHTDFKGEIESGLCKITAVGLGKRKGAEKIHENGLAETIPEGASVALATGKILMGVALVENPFDQPAIVKVVGPDQFLQTDRELLALAKRMLPRIPTDSLHLLVVDEMGKNISGAGMDTNVVGMYRLLGYGERKPDYRYLAALRLTEASHGNASGIGMADFTTRALVDAIDFNQTAINAQTALMTGAARVPITLPTDEECLAAATTVALRISGDSLRAVRVKNTMELQRFWATEPVANEMESAGRAERCGEAHGFAFDKEGALRGPGY